MWRTVREVFAGALKDLSASWRSLTITDLAYKALAFAVLTPATFLFLRWLATRSGMQFVADADIARFFLTNPTGIAAALLGSAILAAIAVLEASCLMVVGFAASRGTRLYAKTALLFGAARASAALRLCGQMILRVIAVVVPFALAIGLVYLGLLRGADINYFLSRRPPVFWVAVVLAGAIVAVLAYLIVRTIIRWTLSLPILIFENVPVYRVLAESRNRSEGHRGVIAMVLGGWALIGAVLNGLFSAAMMATVRAAAPHLADSVSLLVLFLIAMLAVGAVLSVAIAIFTSVLFSLLVVRLWLHAGAPAEVRLPVTEGADDERLRRVTRGFAIVSAVTAVLCATGVALIVMSVTRAKEPVLVFAHRGSSSYAPENTLAAFRGAIAARTDFVELDVQETLDGVVVVAHDSDLMKVAGSPMKIWEHTAEELRRIDIGSFQGESFKNERVPTLAEALATCKGSARVLIELKSYGHNQNLEQKVVDLVEAAGMAKDCAYMSLDHNMVRKMKQLRPEWRVGLLAAKTLGDATTFGADFLAVETKVANARFIRRAHRAGQSVYVWTVDDPTLMLEVMSLGANGLITNKPAMAREVVLRRERMSDAQRILVAILVRAGARTEALESQEALRP